MLAPDRPFIDRDSFEDEAFAGLDLVNTDLSNREFLRCTFTNVQLQDADLRGARLDDCLFSGCDLSRIRAANLAARGVAFVRCRLLASISPNCARRRRSSSRTATCSIRRSVPPT